MLSIRFANRTSASATDYRWQFFQRSFYESANSGESRLPFFCGKICLISYESKKGRFASYSTSFHSAKGGGSRLKFWAVVKQGRHCVAKGKLGRSGKAAKVTQRAPCLT